MKHTIRHLEIYNEEEANSTSEKIREKFYQDT